MKVRITKTFELTGHQAEMLRLEYRRRYPSEDNGNKRADVRTLLSDAVESYVEETANAQRCRVCGCTEYDPCEQGCEWVEADLCSSCVEGGSSDAD